MLRSSLGQSLATEVLRAPGESPRVNGLFAFSPRNFLLNSCGYEHGRRPSCKGERWTVTLERAVGNNIAKVGRQALLISLIPARP